MISKYCLCNSQPVIPKRPIGIIGVGSYLPETVLKNSDLKNVVLSEKEEDFLVFKSGISQRRYANGETHTEIAIKAAQNALEDAQIDASEIDMIVVTHISRDLEQLTPPNSVDIQTALNAKNATAINIDQGFTGWLYAMITGAAFVGSGFYKTVLVVSGETILQNTDSTKLKSMLVGDGGGAFILRETEEGYGILAYHLMSWKHPEIAAEVKTQKHRAAPYDSDESLRGYFTIADNSFERDLPMVEHMLPYSLNKTMHSIGIESCDIDCCIFAQKFKWLNEQWAYHCRIPYDNVHDTIKYHSCIETSSIPIITADALNQKKIHDGNIVAFADLGSNWSVGSMIVKWKY